MEETERKRGWKRQREIEVGRDREKERLEEIEGERDLEKIWKKKGGGEGETRWAGRRKSAHTLSMQTALTYLRWMTTRLGSSTKVYAVLSSFTLLVYKLWWKHK